MQLLNTGVAVLALSAILVIAQKPFAPDLYDRDALELRFEERAATGSAKPYAPDLYVTEDLGDDIFLSFERSLEDNTSKLTKRDGSPSEAMDRNLLSRWNRNEHKHCKSDVSHGRIESEMICTHTSYYSLIVAQVNTAAVRETSATKRGARIAHAVVM